MLTIKVWEKNWNPAKTFWQILKQRMEDTESSTLPCRTSTCLYTTINWIMYSRNWKVLQKLILHLDSFWKTSRMEHVDSFTFTKTILIRRGRNLCVNKLIWLTWQTECTKRILMLFVPEMSQYKVEKLKTYNFDSFCIVTQRCAHGL